MQPHQQVHIATGEEGLDPFASLLVDSFTDKPFDLTDDFEGFGLPRPLSIRRQSSTLSTPFEAAEDDLAAQFLHYLPEDDAATPALVFDEPLLLSEPATDPLFGFEATSPAFAFRQYAPAPVDPAAALRTPPAEPGLPFTCSPVELTADSPPFAQERPLPVTQVKVQTEAQVEEAAAPATRKRKAPAATFTGSRNTHIPLVDIDAPVATRKYTGNSRTSRKAVPVLYQRQTKKQKLDIVDEDGDVLPEHQDAIEAKRLANTVAARRSRQRKAEHLKGLEDTIEALKLQLAQEQAKSRALALELAQAKAAH